MPTSGSPFGVNFGTGSGSPNFFDPNFKAMTDLPSRPTVPSYGQPLGGTPVGMGGGGGFDKAGAVGDIAEVGVPLLLSLFGPENKEAGLAKAGAKDLTAQGADLFKSGTALSKEGQAALMPVLRYLTAVAGGDPTALFEATAPERKRVLDQYDTAKQSLTFEGRGGGRASAALNLEAAKASDLSMLVAEARRQGVRDLGQVGEALTAAGIQSKSAGVSATGGAAGLNADLARQTAEKHRSLGASIGKMVATALPYALMAL